MLRTHLYVTSIALFLSLVVGADAKASSQTAVEFASTSDVGNSNSFNFELGYEFHTNQAIKITSLGFYDSPANATTNSQVVSIYNSNFQLLASATVTSSDSYSHEFLFKAITPVDLLAGQDYQILTSTNYNDYSGADLATDLTVASAITLGGGLEGLGSGSGTSAYLGPNFQFVASAVPEPSSWVLATTGGLLAWTCHSRRRKRIGS